MVELLETRFFALLAGESFEEITKEDLEDEYIFRSIPVHFPAAYKA